jgi:eukaryotic-like serine/threonine-protein kinase
VIFQIFEWRIKMKKVFPFLMIVVFLLAACGDAAPTPISLPTAARTATEAPADAPAAPAEGELGDERVSRADGMIEVFVPAGFFQMGGLDEKAQADEKPAHKVTLDAFWIDKVPVTNAMYDLCVKAGVCNVPREIKSVTRTLYFGNSDFADYPVVYVSWEDARMYCEWAGRRLPTEAEWEYAARGSSDYRTYPWGNEAPSDLYANFNYAVKDTSRVGSYPTGASPFGALDMAGNVWQWVADYYSDTYYQVSPENNPAGPEQAGVNGLRRSIRGGSWLDSDVNIRLANRGFALAPNLEADPLAESYKGDAKDNIGFRCAADN